MEDATVQSGSLPDTTTEKVEQKENNDIIECYARTLSKVKSNEIKAFQCSDSMNEMNEDRSNKESCLLVDHASVSSDDFEQPFKYDYPVAKSSPNNKIPKNVSVKSDSKSPSRSKWQEIEPDSDEEFDPIREIVKCSRMNSADSTTKCLANSKCPSISDHDSADANKKSTSPITSSPNFSTDNNDSAVTCEAPCTDMKTSDIALAVDPNPQDTLIEQTSGEVSDKNDIDKQRSEKEEDDEGSGNEVKDKKDVDDDSKDDDDEEEEEEEDDDDTPEETKVNKMKEIKRKLAIKKLSSLVEVSNYFDSSLPCFIVFVFKSSYCII